MVIPSAGQDKALRRLSIGGQSTQGIDVDYVLYDTWKWVAGAEERYRFFTVPRGQAGKTLSDTNMDVSSMVPAGNKMIVYAMKASLFCETDIDEVALKFINSLIFRTCAEIKFPEKTIFIANLSDIMGISRMISGVVTLTLNQPYSDVNVWKGVYPFNKPIELPSTKAFEVYLENYGTVMQGTLTEFYIRISLIGRLERLG